MLAYRMTCREYTELVWLRCNRLNQGHAYGVLADSRSIALHRRQDGQWVDVIDGTTYGPWPSADVAFDDLELRLAGEGVMVRRRH